MTERSNTPASPKLEFLEILGRTLAWRQALEKQNLAMQWPEDAVSAYSPWRESYGDSALKYIVRLHKTLLNALSP